MALNLASNLGEWRHAPYSESFHVLYSILHSRLHYQHFYDIPNGFRIFSLATLVAISPPFCNAIAPIIAYNDVVSTTSIPEESILVT